MTDTTEAPEKDIHARKLFRVDRKTSQTDEAGLPILLTDLQAIAMARGVAKKEGFEKVSMQQATDEYFEFLAYN